MENINSVISGIVIFKIGKEYIHVKPPSAEDRTFADFFSQEQYDDALIDGIWTQEEAENHLIEMGYWSKEEEEKLKEIENNLENMKVDYFNHFYNSTTKEYILKNIEKQKNKYQDLQNKKYTFYDKTCDYLKKYCFMSYIIQKNAFLQNRKPACSKYSVQLLYNKYINVTNEFNTNARKIANSNDWKHLWYSSKKRPFDNKASSLTDFQLAVISWSSYYDGVYQSLDKPSDDVIEDDIALDGWSIVQRRKRAEDEKKRNAEKILPDKMKDSGEVFIPARNAKEAQDIMSLNNAEAMSHIKSLKKDLQKHGVVEESQLTTTRRELQMQAIQMSKENKRR